MTMEWSELTVASLRELGADQEMVPGAKLRQRMEIAGARSGFDVGEYVATSSNSFSQLVAQIPAVIIKPQPGSDVLIGLSGAAAPTPSQRRTGHIPHGALRQDVYQAFTRIEKVPFVYMLNADRFVPEDLSKGPTVEVDKVSLDVLIDDRRAFVQTLAPEHQAPLREALESSTTPLPAFREQAAALGLLKLWAAHQARTIRARVLSWAEKHNLTPRQAWFTQRPASAHQTFERLLPYLSSDEIRAISIPFRAIEALLADEKNR